MRDRWHDMAQTVRHLAVVTLKWHDLARHIAGHCGNKMRASVRLALTADDGHTRSPSFDDKPTLHRHSVITSDARVARFPQTLVCHF